MQLELRNIPPRLGKGRVRAVIQTAKEKPHVWVFYGFVTKGNRLPRFKEEEGWSVFFMETSTPNIVKASVMWTGEPVREDLTIMQSFKDELRRWGGPRANLEPTKEVSAAPVKETVVAPPMANVDPDWHDVGVLVNDVRQIVTVIELATDSFKQLWSHLTRSFAPTGNERRL